MPLPTYARADGPAIFMEITDRDDLGASLIAPKSGEGGRNAYRLITETQPGDTVLHYHRPSGGIISLSRVAGPPQDSTIWWAAKGASARGKELQPYERPAWEVPLTGYQPLDPPLTQEQVEARRERILNLRARLEQRESEKLHFPYYRYSDTELRTLQAYMALVPRSLLRLFPEILEQVSGYEALTEAELPKPPNPDPDDSVLYLADEEITVNHGGTYSVDPEALTRANQSHAQLQNQLRKRVKASGATLIPAGGANVDLAWRDNGRRQTVHVAEIKSITNSNEEHQLRYGLGQVLDYLDEMEHAVGRRPRGVLFVARAPRRTTWTRKCEAVGVELCWPGRWPSGL